MGKIIISLNQTNTHLLESFTKIEGETNADKLQCLLDGYKGAKKFDFRESEFREIVAQRDNAVKALNLLKAELDEQKEATKATELIINDTDSESDFVESNEQKTDSLSDSKESERKIFFYSVIIMCLLVIATFISPIQCNTQETKELTPVQKRVNIDSIYDSTAKKLQNLTK